MTGVQTCALPILGLKYRLEDIDPPTADRIENAKRILRVEEYHE